MEATLDNARLALPKEGLIALRDGDDTRITCLEGTLWVTQEGTIKDDVLEPGQSLVVRHRGLTLVTALVPAVVTITSGTKKSARPARSWLGLEPRLGAGC